MICRTNKYNPCLLRKRYNKLLDHIWHPDIEYDIKGMIGTLIEATPTEKGFKNLRLLPEGEKLLRLSRVPKNQDSLS